MAGICDIPVISNVCDAVGEGAATLISAPFEWMAEAAGNAAKWLFEGVWELFSTTTLVDITNPDYLGIYNVVFGIAALLTFAFFCLQLIGGLIRREPGALARAATGMAKSVLGAFVLVTIIAALLEITDQLSLGIIQASGTTLEEMGDKIALLVAGFGALNIAAPGVAALITIFLAFLAIAGACIVWFSLLIRKALILICVVIGPIALAGAGWDITKGWFAKWASFVVALIVSKLIVVLVFLVAITQVNAPIDLDLASIADPIAGIALMFIAAFSPYLAYKLLAFAGADMYHLASTEQEAKQALNRPLPVPHAPRPEAPKNVLDGDSSGSSGGGEKPSPASAGDKPPGGSPPAGGEQAASGEAASSAGSSAVPVLAAATVVKKTGEAGVETGHAVGDAADAQADQEIGRAHV